MTSGTISAVKLASVLAEGLVAVVPEEIEVPVEETVVSLRERGTGWGMSADLSPPPDLPARPAAFHPVSEGLQQEIFMIDDEVRREMARPMGKPCVEISEVLGTLESAMDQFQDDVAETLAEPWPAVTPGPMPEAFAEVQDDSLVAGYGDPTDPALTVISVALQDLR